MTDLPKPDVSVTTGEDGSTHKVDLAVSRDGKARSYTGASTSPSGDQGGRREVARRPDDG